VITIVVPVFNEQDSLPHLWREIGEVATRSQLDIEVVFVDDGSRDESWRVIANLARADQRVYGIRLRRNFGKAAALSAGFKAARGDVVFTMDADLQDDPGEIPRFLEALAGKAEVVSGWKRVRHDPWHKVWPSRVFNAMVSRVTGVSLHDHNCGFKCYRSEVLREIRLYGELHRFIPVLAAARGFRISEIETNHRPRSFGHSKYGVSRFVKGLLDLLTVKFLTGFGQRPQHLLGTVGLVAFSLGTICLMCLSGMWVGNRVWGEATFGPLGARPLLTYAVASLLLGAQMVSIGILAELITANTNCGDDASYSVAEQTQRLQPDDQALPGRKAS
jgi:glycosyltransferase involved in cell wall biosynthesis